MDRERRRMGRDWGEGAGGVGQFPIFPTPPSPVPVFERLVGIVSARCTISISDALSRTARSPCSMTHASGSRRETSSISSDAGRAAKTVSLNCPPPPPLSLSLSCRRGYLVWRHALRLAATSVCPRCPCLSLSLPPCLCVCVCLSPSTIHMPMWFFYS